MNLKTYIAFETFNEQSEHKLIIKINDQTIFQQQFEKNKKHSLELDEFYHYKPGSSFIHFQWTGDAECSKKYITFNKIKIQEQNIPLKEINCIPYENDYIQELRSTKAGDKQYWDHILNPGTKHGWYGNYKLTFYLGTKQEILATQRTSIGANLGITIPKVYSK